MKRKVFVVLAAAAVMLSAAAFVASAAPVGPVGREAPITKDLAAYFSGYGVDPQYLGVPLDKVPADQAAKIATVLGMQDDKTNGLYPHTQLSLLVQQALNAAVDKEDDPVYVLIGDHVWEVELGQDPSNVIPSGAPLTAAQAAWVPLS